MSEFDPLAVYIHWPYCTRICPYCDFNVYKAKGRNDALLESMLKDLKGWREDSGPRKITSIHFGGGTPSLLSAQNISSLIKSVKTLWGLESDTEVALEANPIDADKVKWEEYRVAGINRLSLGAQTFDSQALELLGRDHDGIQAINSLKLAKSIFPSVSSDIIFGWVGQTLTQLKRDIEIILNANIDHISTYQLTIEEGTAFAKAESRGQKRVVEENLSADYFEYICQTLKEVGFEHYEVSNFAKTGHASQHNLAYWRSYDYVGVGPGAHGRLTSEQNKYATICELTPESYINSVNANGRGYICKDKLSSSEQAEEFVLMGLRINDGFSLKKYAEISGEKLNPKRYNPLISDGLLKLEAGKISSTDSGRLVLNALTDALLV